MYNFVCMYIHVLHTLYESNDSKTQHHIYCIQTTLFDVTYPFPIFVLYGSCEHICVAHCMHLIRPNIRIKLTKHSTTLHYA